MDEEPPTLDYDTPPRRPANPGHINPEGTPPREYRGCLVPLGILVGVIGLAIFPLRWRPMDMSPGERKEELGRVAAFAAIAVALILTGFLRKRSR